MLSNSFMNFPQNFLQLKAKYFTTEQNNHAHNLKNVRATITIAHFKLCVICNDKGMIITEIVVHFYQENILLIFLIFCEMKYELQKRIRLDTLKNSI